MLIPICFPVESNSLVSFDPSFVALTVTDRWGYAPSSRLARVETSCRKAHWNKSRGHHSRKLECNHVLRFQRLRLDPHVGGLWWFSAPQLHLKRDIVPCD